MKNALSSLTNIQSQVDVTNNRLATGKKVNSALDNALNFFIADSFNARARGLQTIMDNIGLGLNVLKQTDKALNSIKSSLEQAEGTMRAALQTAGTNARMVSTFSFRNPNTGAADPSQNFFAADTDTSRNRLQSGDSFTINLATYDASGNVVSTLGTVTVTNGASTVQEVLNAINAAGSGDELNEESQSPRVFAYLNDAGNLVVENAVSGRDELGNTFGVRFSMTNADAATPSQNSLQVFTFSGAVGGAPANTTIGTAQEIVNMMGSSTLQGTRQSASASFREVLNQVRNTALDAGYNGTNLLQGDFLRTVFNLEETTSIVTQGRRVDATDLGFTLDNIAASQGDALRNFQSDREISNGLAKIRVAKETITSLATAFATNANLLTNRQDYTKAAMKNFSDGADLLTIADINEEGATLSSLQTRQQLSVTALSLANQSDQAILRLF
jgi:flagellin-like hook-associated protein FlgL